MSAIKKIRRRLLWAVTIISFAMNVSAMALAQEETATASYAPTALQLQQLVTPIALYPDTLVAQILAASQYPTQIVEADRFVQQNSGKTADQLASAASGMDWDASILALLRFPSVLHNMDQNLSWTSALGQAYYNDPKGVMSAIQVMRNRAYQAGTLQSTRQQTVTLQGGTSGTQTIIIQPANPQVVYVPTYNPTAVYGAPAEVYPGYSGTDMLAGALLGFGTGIAVGALASSAWGCNWYGGGINYNNNVYIAHNSVWGPNRWGPYNPYHPYNPYNPYHPYNPYNPYHPYNPYNPYHPYNPYNNRLYSGNAYHPYNNAYHPYNAQHPYNGGYHPTYNTTMNRNSVNAFNHTSNTWNHNSLNNYRGYDQHASSGLENRGAFGDFGQGGDSRMASDRGASSLGGWGHSGGGFGHASGGSLGHFGGGHR